MECFSHCLLVYLFNLKIHVHETIYAASLTRVYIVAWMLRLSLGTKIEAWRLRVSLGAWIGVWRPRLRLGGEPYSVFEFSIHV